MNDRIKRLRDKWFETKPRVSSERCVIFTESMKKNVYKPIAVKRSMAYYDVLDKMTVVVNDDELIVGNMCEWAKASPIYPEYSTKWLREELGGKPYKLNERPGDTFEIGEKEKNEILECLDYWEDKNLYDQFRASLPEYANDAWDTGVIDDWWVSSQGLGNELVNYGQIVNKGLVDVIERIEKRISELNLKEPGEVKKKFFLEGALRGNRAVVNYSNRLAAKCEEEAEKANPQRRDELLKMAEICKRVPQYPARSFHEAVQSIFTVLVAVHLESNGHAISLGRFDQYVYPLYKKDLEAGKITREEALEIVESFYLKCNELNKLRSWGDTEFFAGYQMFINIACGGQDKDGNDLTNEISYMEIEACRDLRMFTPSVSLKVHDKTPNELMMAALDAAIVHQGGMPAFYNDKAFYRILDNMGIDKDDRCDWCPVGCIEAGIPGKWDFAAKGPWLSVEKVLDLTLNNGYDLNSGKLIHATTKPIEECKTMDEIVFEYKEMLKYIMDINVEIEHINDYVHCLVDINPFRASLIEDCIGRGLDLVEGGSIYSADGGPTAGTISAGDALAALDYAIFDKKILTLEQILHACRTNYEDMETVPSGPEVRAILLNKAPKFGNDDDAADKYIVELEDFIGSRLRNEYHSSKYGKGPIPCCYSYSQSPVTGNIGFGTHIKATPDGRKDGDPVNNGISPANGSEKNGASAVCNSVGKLPSIWFHHGAIFNMRLTKSSIATKEHRQKIIDMVLTLFDKNALQIQFNVVDNEVLKDAMVHPENYKDLMVRVSGYSALFTSLAPDCQMDVINRAEVEV